MQPVLCKSRRIFFFYAEPLPALCKSITRVSTAFAPSSIRFFYPQKSIHPFTWRLFMFDFQRVRVWRFGFLSIHLHCGVFIRLCADFQCFSGVKAYAFHPSQAFTARVNALQPMWTLWNQNLHTRNRCKLEENEHGVNGWILFWGNKIRIYTRA